MTLDELSKIEAAMTPGKWHDSHMEMDDSGRVIMAGGRDRIRVNWNTNTWRKDCEADAAGLVALRNAAPALIECARLLREIRTFAHNDPRWSDKTVRLTNHCLARIDAALARLEEIK